MKIKAAFLEKLNTPLAVDSLNLPNLGCGQVLVQVHCSGICGAQIGEILGAKGEDKYLPHLLGHEGSGIVVDVGDGISQVKKGDHVVLHWRKGKGIECRPPKYHLINDFYVGGGWVTTFNDYAIISENRLTVIDKDIPFDIASLMGCAVTTGLGVVNNEARLKIGQSILILGCGGVGLNVVQGATMVSAGRVAVMDIIKEKVDLAKKFGATEFYLSNTFAGFKDTFDVVVDCTGLACMIDFGLKHTASGGKLILVGQPDWYKDVTFTQMRQNYCGKTIVDSQGGLTDPNVDIPKYLGLYKSGKLKLNDLITNRFPLEKVNDALDLVRSKRIGKCILEMGHD